VKFEYVPAKSVGNKTKHGIDFEEATRLGVSRQALIKVVMDSHLQHAKSSHA